MSRSLAALGAAGLLVLGACADGGDPGGPSSSTGGEPRSDGRLTIGTLLPQTGSLAFLGPATAAAADLAVGDVNDAGGVLGEDVVLDTGDSGDTSTNIASQTVDRLLSDDVDVIVGAVSSAVSLTVIDKIIAAGAVQVSPGNTAVPLSTYPDKGLYFRTAPPDTVQGAVLGRLLAADGHDRVAVLARQDVYGEGLSDTVRTAFAAAGGTVVSRVVYDWRSDDFAADVAEVARRRPQAVVLVGFDESAAIVRELVDQGLGPPATALYLVDGNLSNRLYLEQPAGTMSGAQGTRPGGQLPVDFPARLLEVDAELVDLTYAAETYDAVVLSALAAEAAGSDAGRSVAAALVGVSEGGQRCTTYASCLALLESGADIDYDGVSGPVDFQGNGDPGRATVGVYRYGPDNTFGRAAVRFVTSDVPLAR